MRIKDKTRIRRLAFLLASVLACSFLLSGCGKKENPGNSQNSAAYDEKKDAETIEKIVPSAGDEVFSWIRKGFSRGNQAYFRIRDGATNLYGLADKNGNIVIPAEYDALNIGEGSVYAYRFNGKSYHNVIFNQDLKELFSWDDEKYYIRACNDGVASFAADIDPGLYIYMDLEATDGKFLDPAEDFGSYVRGSVFYNGYALINSAKQEGGLTTCSFMNRKGEYRSFYFKPVNALMRIPIMPNTNEYGSIIPMTKDGWILYDVPPVYAQVIQIPGGNGQLGFYNVKAGQITRCPEGYGEEYVWAGIWGGPAGTDIYLQDGYALWTSIHPADPSVPEYKVYDINQGRFMTDDTYSYLELDDLNRTSEHILCQKMDGTWGYLTRQFHPERFFEDATSFYNGHALIVEDGKTYVIDENFHIVSDPIEGDGCYMLQSDEDAVYAAVHDPAANGYHILTMAGGTGEKNTYTLDPSLTDRVGTYVLTEMYIDGKDICTMGATPKEELPKKASIELDSKGTGRMFNDLQLLEFIWDGEKFYSDGEAMLYQYDNGRIEMNFPSGEGMLRMIFQRE